jgi:UDP-2,3-diacylglucosamine hydrolase
MLSAQNFSPSFSVISDTHAMGSKGKNPAGDKILLAFLEDCLAREEKEVVLLGDIFDMMIGGHSEYFEVHRDFFDIISKLVKIGTKIIYIEGNHDFHLKKLLKMAIAQFQLDSSLVIGMERGYSKEIAGKRFFLTHGDFETSGDWKYLAYRNFMGTAMMEVVANYIPYNFLAGLGKWASENSRERQRVSPVNLSAIREKHREQMVNFAVESGHDVVIFGHNHIKEDFTLIKDEKTVRLLNNGFAQNSETYLKFAEGEFCFIRL